MRDLVVLFIHFIATLARLLRPGGDRSIVAESLLLKHQLLILNRSRQRAPNLSASDRWLANCYFAHNSLEFPVLLGFCDARSDRPFHPFHRYPGSLAQTWRCPFRRCRVASAELTICKTRLTDYDYFS
jgi:hypothetical protein